MGKYPALQVLIGINRILAFLWLGAWILASIFMSDSMVLSRSETIVGSLLIGVVGFVLILASGEIFEVLIDIETNTRKSAPVVSDLPSETDRYQKLRGEPKPERWP